MNMKKIFSIMNHADDESVNRLAHYPAADQKALDRMYALTQEKLSAPETEETFIEPPAPRLQWTRAAIVASALVICGTAAAGIGALSRMTPPPEELTAEITPAASAEATAPEAESPTQAETLPAVKTEAVTSLEAASAVIVTETQTETETQATEGTAVSTETLAAESPVTTAVPAPTEAAVSAPAAETVQIAETVTETDIEDIPVLPGFRIEAAVFTHIGTDGHGNRTETTEGGYKIYSDHLGGGTQERFVAEEPEYLPDGSYPYVEFNMRSTQKYYYPATNPDGTNISDAFIVFDQHTRGGTSFCQEVYTEMQEYVSVTPVTVNGCPGFLSIYGDNPEKSASDPQFYTSYCLAWDRGDYIFRITTENIPLDFIDELFKMAESVAPIE